MTIVSIEEFRREQRADFERRKQLAREDPERAREEANARLRRAGIIDEHGRYVPTARG
ncbi:MAG: hypothetical protein Q4B54_13120 [Coriobacteriales bacterium]|nr:hypothetical protein [Coriobacteriales bacterium]